ncbi:hypothetical protein FRX31_034928 [Thalictrum thalictroides]|uniref:F-box domain-containing protein n=1 Tax=Thalictrum thalictroides TaxID=46969 RepID=A0A7J6UTE2_THATH|nr:hypothetical protein FRX31_034928 [Thalictrum thalictroides]
MATPRLKDVENQDNTKRDWLELPHDVMSLIFIKLGAIDILYRAQWVCSSWRNLSKQPYLFHSIDLCYKADNKDYCGIDYKLVKEAFDRSCGHLVEFFADEYWFSGGDYLDYFADNSIALKCFRFNLEGFTLEEELLLIDVVRKAPSLEEIGVSYYHHFPTVFLEEVEITEQTTKICEKSGKTVRLPNDDGKHRWDDYAPNFYQNHFYDLDSLGF